MVYVARYYDEIRLWWDGRTEKKPGMKYKVTVNNEWCVYTDYIYYNFKNFESGTEYFFEIALVDENKEVVGISQSLKTSTLISRKHIDVTRAPYSAKGDAKTDNTKVFNKVLEDNPQDTLLEVPTGVYLCEEMTFSGNIDIQLDSGAIICDKQTELGL